MRPWGKSGGKLILRWCNEGFRPWPANSVSMSRLTAVPWGVVFQGRPATSRWLCCYLNHVSMPWYRYGACPWLLHRCYQYNDGCTPTPAPTGQHAPFPTFSSESVVAWCGFFVIFLYGFYLYKYWVPPPVIKFAIGIENDQYYGEKYVLCENWYLLLPILFRIWSRSHSTIKDLIWMQKWY